MALVVPGVALASCGGQPAKPTTPSGFQGRVAAIRKQAQAVVGRAPGVLVSVREGPDHETLAIGKAMRNPDRALAASDTVMIASVTKSLVATAAMSLVQDGSLELNDTVEKWLPGVLPSGKRIRVAHLLSMSSGLPDYEDAPGYPGPGVLPARALVSLVAKQSLRFEPGSRGEQSNTNYAVLGLVIERAAKAPLEQVVRRRVLAPARLTHTSMGGTPTAHGYEQDHDATVRDPENPSAAAGAVSTVDDLGGFLDLLVADRIVGAREVKAMERVRSEVEDEEWGLGLRVREVPCGTAYGQVGVNPGYAIEAWTVPRKERTAVVAVTSGAADVDAATLADDWLCG